MVGLSPGVHSGVPWAEVFSAHLTQAFVAWCIAIAGGCVSGWLISIPVVLFAWLAPLCSSSTARATQELHTMLPLLAG